MNDSVRFLKRELAITQFTGWLLFLTFPILLIIALFAWDWRWAVAGGIVGICQQMCAASERAILTLLGHEERGERMWSHAKTGD